jgi:hypothetical protein
VDTLIKLNELMVKMQLGLESRVGALRELGEEFPDEKAQELFGEQIQDAKMDGAKRILDAHISAIIMQLTGIVPEGAGDPVAPGETTQTSTRKPDGTTTKQTKETKPSFQPLPGIQGLPGLGDVGAVLSGMDTNLLTDIVTQAYGTRLPQRRIVDENADS